KAATAHLYNSVVFCSNRQPSFVCMQFVKRSETVIQVLEVSRFHCWAGWEEKKYKFLVVGEDDGVPQYCLRFPREVGEQFTVLVYFSVLCPLREDGKPPTGIEYHEMNMQTLVDRCVDDDIERCEAVKARGQCKKEEKYAMHCERSCDKCVEQSQLLDILCPFPSSVQGSWLFLDVRHKEQVRVNQTTVAFERLGSFTCKERSFTSHKLFKTVTLFNNGCSMRYTCFEFYRRTENVLQFRIGTSARGDTGFENLCKFEDGASPLNDLYRGSKPRNLI
ncbi:hypothetical protein MAR_024202, partial [Mya arenaria]